MTKRENPGSYVTITCDFDAISTWLAAKAISPGLISRGEYGARVGVPRLLNLFDRYDIKTTWFIPGHTIETFQLICEEVCRRGHEIAHHGYCHESTGDLPHEDQRDILCRGIECIKALTGQKPLGYRSPAFEEISEYTFELLLEHDFLYDSSLMGDDFRPYLCRVGDKASLNERYEFGRTIDVVEIPVTWDLDDWPPFGFSWAHPYRVGFSSPDEIYKIWVAQFDYMYEHVDGGVYSLILHPQVSGRAHVLTVVERLITHILTKPNVEFRRMSEIALAWKDMQVSSSGSFRG